MCVQKSDKGITCHRLRLQSNTSVCFHLLPSASKPAAFRERHLHLTNYTSRQTDAAVPRAQRRYRKVSSPCHLRFRAFDAASCCRAGNSVTGCHLCIFLQRRVTLLHPSLHSVIISERRRGCARTNAHPVFALASLHEHKASCLRAPRLSSSVAVTLKLQAATSLKCLMRESHQDSY